MEDNKTELVTTSVIADTSDPAEPVAPRKEFVEPEVSEPVDIMGATKVFLQISGE